MPLPKNPHGLCKNRPGIACCSRLLHREKGSPARECARAVHPRLGMPLNAPLSRMATAMLYHAIGLFRLRVLARRELRAYAIRI